MDSPDSHESQSHQKAHFVSLWKKPNPHSLVLVGSRNGFERDLLKQKITCFTIKLYKLALYYKYIVYNILNGILSGCNDLVKVKRLNNTLCSF